MSVFNRDRAVLRQLPFTGNDRFQPDNLYELRKRCVESAQLIETMLTELPRTQPITV